ncbi:MAG: insulinase family protein [Alphaproteobacteria bacterium]|nr:insulinase family protein [Alphaproteobacteria bacterium]
MRRFGLIALLLLFALPAHAIQPTRLEGLDGMQALVISNAHPMLTLRLVFKGSGGIADSEGKEGLATMLAAMLKEGAGDMDAIAFKRRLERHGIELSFEADTDNLMVNLRCLTRDRDEAFRLLRLAITEPRFDSEAVARVRSEMLSRQRQIENAPFALAELRWMQTAFPKHGYGFPPYGTETSLDAITPPDLRNALRERLVGTRLVASLVGNISPEEAAALFNRWLTLPSGLPADEVERKIAPETAGKTVTVIRDGTQAVLTFGHEGIRREDKDYFAAFLLNYILGNGDFSSRLMQELRERRAIAYSVQTRLEEMAALPLFGGGVSTRPEKAEEAKAVIESEIRKLRKEGVTENELALAKRYLTGSFALQLDTDNELVAYLTAMQLYHLGDDYLEKRNAYLEAVTLEDVLRTARRLLAPEKLLWVVVTPAAPAKE